MSEYTGADALLALEQSLSEVMQSPEAIRMEAEFRIGKIQELLNAGNWLQDPSGNVVPSNMSEADKRVVENGSRFSIIGSLPVLAGTYGFNAEMRFTSTGSLVDGATILLEYPTLCIDVDLHESSIVDSTILFSNNEVAHQL